MTTFPKKKGCNSGEKPKPMLKAGDKHSKMWNSLPEI
jgi:hypothetical protein